MTISTISVYQGDLPSENDPVTFDARMAALMEYQVEVLAPEVKVFSEEFNAQVVPIAANLEKLANTYLGAFAVPPITTFVGARYLDTSVEPNIERIWNGTSFVASSIFASAATMGVGIQHIQTTTAVNAASVVFTGLNDTHIIRYDNLVSEVADVALQLRTSTDNGATFHNGPSDYSYVADWVSGAPTYFNSALPLNYIPVTTQFVSTNPAHGGGEGEIQMSGLGAARRARFRIENTNVNAAETLFLTRISGYRNAAIAVNAVELKFGVGPIKLGTFSLYKVIR